MKKTHFQYILEYYSSWKQIHEINIHKIIPFPLVSKDLQMFKIND